jgi:signal transduction histidine kinase
MRTFTQRLTLRFAALVTATTIAVLAAGGWLIERQMVRNVGVLHEVEFQELRRLIGPNPALTAADVARRISQDVAEDAALYFIQVHSDRGDVLFRSPNLGPNYLPDLTGSELHRTIELPGVGTVYASEFHDGPWHVQVASPLGPVRRLLREYLDVSLWLVAAVASAGLALGYAFSRMTLRPLRAIEATANRIRSDNLSERIPVAPGGDELAALARLLNQMFDRLQASFEQVRRFAADVSHEVKTPLALIRLNAEKLRTRLGGDAEGQAAVADLLEEIDRINQVADRLLFLAKAESGALQRAVRPVAVPGFLAPLAEDAQALAADRGATLVVEPDDAGEIAADPELLRQMLLNLVANAVSVSPPGGRVTLASIATADGWRFEVIDEGPGLAPAQLARLFERFVRFEPAASGGPKRGGHGLGLAICKSIAELHGGSIRVANRVDRSGLRVTVDLPR